MSTDNMPLFVIFLPVRNGADYVREALDSVFAQTFQNWRLVVLDNASCDATPDILAALSDNRVEVLRTERPLGIYENWHRGFDYLQSGEHDDSFVTFLGHDDLFYPSFLAQIADLIATDPEATLYQTMFDLIDDRGDLRRACHPIPERESWRDILGSLCWNQRDSFGTGYVFRGKDYRKVGGIPDLPLLLYSDHLLFTRLTRLGHKACSPTIDFAYRLRRGSTSFRINPAKANADAEALTTFVDALLSEYQEFTSSQPGRAAVASLLARTLFLLNTPVLKRSMSLENKRRLEWLEGVYSDMARGIPMGNLVGAPTTPSRLINALRRLNMTVNFIRRR